MSKHMCLATAWKFLPSFSTTESSYKTDDHMQSQNKVPHSVLNKTKIFPHFTSQAFFILFFPHVFQN